MRTLLEWVLDRFPQTPKKRAKQWIVAGRVRVGNVVVRRPERLLPDPGDALELLGRSSTDASDAEQRIHPQLAILYFDTSLAVVNKTAGLLSVPAGRSGQPSALRVLRDFLKSGPAAYRKLVPLPVHRIDRYTSGVFCIALNPRARKILIEEFSAHRVVREYVAYVDGRPASPSGTWRHRLRLDDDGYRQTVESSGARATAGGNVMDAVTKYEVMEEFAPHRRAGGGAVITKLRLKLFTGCKHQIRIQAAQEGLPVIGDRTYHPRYIAAARGGLPAPIEFPRQALHAGRLELIHPEQPGNRMTWTAPLPDDLKRLESVLRHPS